MFSTIQTDMLRNIKNDLQWPKQFFHSQFMHPCMNLYRIVQPISSQIILVILLDGSRASGLEDSCQRPFFEPECLI